MVTVVRDDEAGGQLSLLAVERGTPGFERGRKLGKVGHRAQDTSELFYSDARVPCSNRLGAPGQGLTYLKQNLPQERLSMAEVGRERCHVDRCIQAHVDGELTAVEAAAVKLTATELQFQVVDRCLQLHGGYGYMEALGALLSMFSVGAAAQGWLA